MIKKPYNVTTSDENGNLWKFGSNSRKWWQLFLKPGTLKNIDQSCLNCYHFGLNCVLSSVATKRFLLNLSDLAFTLSNGLFLLELWMIKVNWNKINWNLGFGMWSRCQSSVSYDSNFGRKSHFYPGRTNKFNHVDQKYLKWQGWQSLIHF